MSGTMNPDALNRLEKAGMQAQLKTDKLEGFSFMIGLEYIVVAICTDGLSRARREGMCGS